MLLKKNDLEKLRNLINFSLLLENITFNSFFKCYLLHAKFIKRKKFQKTKQNSILNKTSHEILD